MAPWVKVLVKVATVVPAVVDGIKFAVQKVKARKKAKFTESERAQALDEARQRLDRILADAKAEDAKAKARK